ncbi:transporter [Pontibacter beigongshangensis]|uniref:transporter n=1 Tax=Pontibacter beigongshangensis TaxID=2574733 RepID=UPI001F511765|nr:transporter [Pontibacter beigongshangensis]
MYSIMPTSASVRCVCHLKYLLTFCVVVLLAIRAIAQDEPPEMITDRPDQTESSVVMPRNMVQLESGFFFQKDWEGARELKSHAYPTTLLRVGVLEGLELLFLAAYRDSVIQNGERRKLEGMGPLSVGAKAKLWDEKGWLPQAALLFRVLLPTGDRRFRPSGAEPHMRLNLSHALTSKIEFAYNLVHGWSEGKSVPGYTASVSYEIADKFTVFAEVFGSKEEGEPAGHQADAGILFLLLPNLQLDAAFGTRLNSAAPDYFIITGFSVRLPR